MGFSPSGSTSGRSSSGVGKPRLLIALVALTVISAVTAAVIPAGAYASHISIDDSPISNDPTALAIHVDSHVVVVHAPDGMFVFGSSESGPPSRVDLKLASTGGAYGMTISIEAGPGPRAGRRLRDRDGRPIYVVRRGHGLAWDGVRGATVVVESRQASQGQLLEVIEGLEIDPERT